MEAITACYWWTFRINFIAIPSAPYDSPLGFFSIKAFKNSSVLHSSALLRLFNYVKYVNRNGASISVRSKKRAKKRKKQLGYFLLFRQVAFFWTSLNLENMFINLFFLVTAGNDRSGEVTVNSARWIKPIGFTGG